MNIQELKDFFSKSDYSDETKSMLNGVLADKTEVTPGLISEIKDILQKELDADFEELGVSGIDTPEYKALEKDYVDALDNIDKDLAKDMEFVDTELKELDEIRKKIAKASDEMEADRLRNSM